MLRPSLTDVALQGKSPEYGGCGGNKELPGYRHDFEATCWPQNFECSVGYDRVDVLSLYCSHTTPVVESIAGTQLAEKGLVSRDSALHLAG